MKVHFCFQAIIFKVINIFIEILIHLLSVVKIIFSTIIINVIVDKKINMLINYELIDKINSIR